MYKCQGHQSKSESGTAQSYNATEEGLGAR